MSIANSFINWNINPSNQFSCLTFFLHEYFYDHNFCNNLMRSYIVSAEQLLSRELPTFLHYLINCYHFYLSTFIQWWVCWNHLLFFWIGKFDELTIAKCLAPASSSCCPSNPMQPCGFWFPSFSIIKVTTLRKVLVTSALYLKITSHNWGFL